MRTIFFKRTALLAILLFGIIAVQAQAPSGYYDAAEGKTGAELKTALYNIIKGHTDLGYGGLYTTYQTSDNIVINGQDKVYDMYSIRADETADYYYSHSSSDQCGTYSVEGDCYNREHSMPQSWFNEKSPMKNDAHHVVPTDGKVNGIRSNFPHAEVGSVRSDITITSNGSKLGPCSTPGYSGKVFEPIDEYKGDFARMYMYMATRYENLIGSWSGNGTASTVLAGNSFPVYKEWYIALLLKWHEQDPVSDKELERNEAVYDRQHNRNPFIDNPDYAEMIWGSNPLNFSSTPVTSATTGVPYSYSVVATSTVSGASLTITAPTKPNWLTLTAVSNGNATLSGTPTTVGSFSVVVQVSDGTYIKQQSFSISVEDAPSTVAFTSTPVTTATVASAYTYSVSTSSTIATAASISATEKPEWLTLNASSNGTATLSGTPSADNIGENSVVLKANNGTDEVEQSFVITVQDTASAGVGARFIETFENMPENSSSYSSISWTGDNDFNWSATNSRTDQTIDSRAVCLKNSSSTYLQSQTLTGGCSVVGFTYQQEFSGSNGQLTIFINNTQIGVVDVSNDVQTDSFAVNTSGDYIIKLESNGAARIKIDNLFWCQNGGSTVENQKPTISGLNLNPEAPKVNQSITVSATITDSDGTITSAQLLWGTTQDNLANTLNMSASSSVYSAVIPAQTEAGTIYFRIKATDNLGLTNLLNQSVQILPSYSPVISNITFTPLTPTDADAVTVSAAVTDEDNDLASVKLYWGLAQSSMTNMLNMSGNSDVYISTIPAQTAGSTVYLKVVAIDAEENETSSNINSYSVSAYNHAPEVSNVSYSPENPNQNNSVSINADVSDSDGNLDDVKLFWGLQSDNLSNSVHMEWKNGLTHFASIPAQAANSTVYFKIIAFDVAGRTDTTEVYSYTVSFYNAIDNNLFSRVKIYPNPTRGLVTVECAELEITRVELFNTLGVSILNDELHQSSLKIDISNYPKGVYMLRIWTNDKMRVFRIVRE